MVIIGLLVLLTFAAPAGAPAPETPAQTIRGLAGSWSYGPWLRMSVDDPGGYSVMQSASKTFDGSHCEDVHPADGANGFMHVIDAAAYTFSSTVPDGHGGSTGSHTRCART